LRKNYIETGSKNFDITGWNWHKLQFYLWCQNLASAWPRPCSLGLEKCTIHSNAK